MREEQTAGTCAEYSEHRMLDRMMTIERSLWSILIIVTGREALALALMVTQS